MSMHQGIDLSRFKKTASDDKSSTLRHAKGHEIKIAHSGLSESMRAHLKGMPLHLAEGTPDNPVSAKEDIIDENMDAPEKQDAAEMAPQVAPPVAAPAPTSHQVAPPTGQPAAMAAPAVAPAPAAQDLPHAAGISPEDKMQELMALARDQSSGVLHPKTYNDLYAENGTLGKIGTLFGLLVAGAGSGLTHQPNAVMQMMDNEINRDFEKQKLDKENGRNFLSLQYQHNLQQAQIAEHMQHVSDSQATMLPKVAGNMQYLESVIGAPAAKEYYNSYNRKAQEVWAPYEAKAKGYITAGNYMEKLSNSNPTAKQVYQTQVGPATAKRASDTLKEGAAAVNKALMENPRQPIVNQNKLSAAIRLGQGTPQGVPYQPGAIDPHDVGDIQKESAALAANRNAAYNWYDSYNKLNNVDMAGQVPGVSSILTGAGTLLGGLLGGKTGAIGGGGLAHALGGLTKESFERKREIEKHGLIANLAKSSNLSTEAVEQLADSMLPAWNDTDSSREEAFRKAASHFQLQEITPTLDRYNSQIPGLKSSFPNFVYKKREEEKPAKESDKPKTSNDKKPISGGYKG